MADVKFLSNLVVDGNLQLTAGGSFQIKNATFESVTADPTTNNFEGRMIYRSDEDKVKFYDGTNWQSIAGDITEVAIASGSSNQLSVSSGTGPVPTISVTTGAVTDGGTALATGDQIYDFVTGLGYGTGTVTSVGLTAGALIDVSGGPITSSGNITVDVDLSELTDMTETIVSSDEFVVLDASSQKRKAASEIPLSIFNNDSGFTTNTGTVTSVSGGNGLTGTVTTSGSLAVGAGTGITVNADDVAVTAAQTGITSVLNASLKVGRDADNDIDFSTDNQIIFRANGADQIKLQDGALVPVTDNDIDLGTSSFEFKDAYFDGTVTADSFSGPLTGNADTATNADNVVVSDATSNTNFQVTFVSDGGGSARAMQVDGSASDTITYNPSTQTLTVKNLTVSGTQTTNNVEIIETSNGIVFEGTTDDANETTLTAADPTADRDIVLPNKSGTVALTADLPGDATSVTNGKARVTAGGGIDVSVDSGNFTVSAEDSSASNKGVVIVSGGTGITVSYSSGTATVDADSATTSAEGIVELATTAEALAGTDTSRAVTPAGLAARSFTADVGDGTETSYTITHNLGTRDVIVQCYDASSYETLIVDTNRATTNTVVLRFNTAPSADDVRCLITKVD